MKKKKLSDLSQNDIYEMETDNEDDYSFDRLEFAEEIDMKKSGKEYVEEIRIPMKKKRK